MNLPPDVTILLVEDESNDVFLMQRALKLANVTNPVHVAEHGLQAMDYLIGQGQYADRIQFPLPQLVFLDLKLPYKADSTCWRTSFSRSRFSSRWPSSS